MSLLRGVIVAHANLASGLVSAVEQIAGSETGLVAVSNRDCDRGALEARVLAAVDDQPTVVFVDMPSGSCGIAVMRRLSELPTVRVVTGVNLAMLLEFVFNRDGDLDGVSRRVAAAGISAVAVR